MFCVNEAEAAAIRMAFEQDGELSAAVELRRLFPGVRDTAKAREMVKAIVGWQPRPAEMEEVGVAKRQGKWNWRDPH